MLLFKFYMLLLNLKQFYFSLVVNRMFSTILCIVYSEVSLNKYFPLSAYMIAVYSSVQMEPTNQPTNRGFFHKNRSLESHHVSSLGFLTPPFYGKEFLVTLRPTEFHDIRTE